MARDYKHRVQNNSDASGRRTSHKQRPPSNPKVGIWKWMLITALSISFAVFLLYLRTMNKPGTTQTIKTATIADLAKTDASNKKEAEEKKKSDPDTKKETPPPQFDFYTILPKKEVVIADHEIKARSREERVGKGKDAHYVIQAGSFKVQQEANQLRNKLAAMGIESKINKAKVGDVIWFRVKIGPYARLVSVNTVMSRLQQNGMRPVITEVEN